MHDERGQSLSVLATMLVPVLVLLCGLVIDGGGHLSASRTAESVAARASRAGADVAPTGGPLAARLRAQQVLSAHGVAGSVTVEGRRVHVHTTVEHRTVFLSVIGWSTLSAEGRATAELVSSPPN